MKTYFNKQSRYIAIQIPNEGAYIGDSEANPTLSLRFSFNKNYKAYSATASYIEIENAGGYSVEKWQSDWPLLQFGFTKTARYSEKALREFADNLLTEIQTTGFANPTLQNLYNRQTTQEVAA